MSIHDARPVWAQTDLSLFKKEQLSRIGAFDPDKRVEVHTTMNELFLRLWGAERKRKIVVTARTLTFPRNPILQISDRDGDTLAEEFAYLREKNNMDTRDFGFFFDLNGDGLADYLIFFGGSVNAEIGESVEIWWMNYHAIDSNGDGTVDNVLYQGSTDLDGNQKVEPDIGLWLIDDDYDTRLDRVMYTGTGMTRLAEVDGDEFDLSDNLVLRGKGLKRGDAFAGLWDQILSDINRAGKPEG
jgi:hypothetical protein